MLYLALLLGSDQCGPGLVSDVTDKSYAPIQSGRVYCGDPSNAGRQYYTWSIDGVGGKGNASCVGIKPLKSAVKTGDVLLDWDTRTGQYYFPFNSR
jgi:hypothetical protein